MTVLVCQVPALQCSTCKGQKSRPQDVKLGRIAETKPFSGTLIWKIQTRNERKCDCRCFISVIQYLEPFIMLMAAYTGGVLGDFISGVHGVGKSYFCNLLKERLGISAYTSSQLIAKTKQSDFSPDKKVADIDQNQLYLLEAVDNLKSQGEEFLLDGHFCLYNADGEITRIPEDTFTQLNPDAIVLLTEDPTVIAQRRLERDQVENKPGDIARFQNAEIEYAKDIAARLGVPLKISQGSNDVDGTIDFTSRRI